MKISIIISSICYLDVSYQWLDVIIEYYTMLGHEEDHASVPEVLLCQQTG